MIAEFNQKNTIAEWCACGDRFIRKWKRQDYVFQLQDDTVKVVMQNTRPGYV